MICKCCGKEFNGWGRYSKDYCSQRCSEKDRLAGKLQVNFEQVLIVVPRRLYLKNGMEPLCGAIYKADKMKNASGYRYRITVNGRPLLLREDDCWEVELGIQKVGGAECVPRRGWKEKVLSLFLKNGYGM